MTSLRDRQRVTVSCLLATRCSRRLAAATLLSAVFILPTAELRAQSPQDRAPQERAPQERVVTVLGFGGSYGEAINDIVIRPFERETGYKVVYDETCCARVSATLKSGRFLADVVIGIDNGGLRNWTKNGFLESDERIAQLGTICGGPKRYVQPTSLILHEYFYVIAANGRAAKLPDSWASFWDTKAFPGPRLLNRISPVAQLEAALLADGAEAKDLYPLDLDRAFSSLDRLRNDAKLVFGQSGADQVNMLATGVAEYAIGYSNRMYAGVYEGLPLNFTLKHALGTETGAGLLKTARNVEGAVAFLSFHARPEVLAALADRTGLLPYCHKADPLITAPDVWQIVAQTAGGDDRVRIDADYWGEHRESVGARWVEWLVK